MKSEVLSIVLLDDVNFKVLVNKIEIIFEVTLSLKNDKGRNKAKAIKENCEISLIDRIDELSEIMCDEYHTLEIKVNFINGFDYRRFESNIIKLLDNGLIEWQRGVWTKLILFEDTRVIYPQPS